MNKNYLFTSESVTEGHPDKVCDQISDSVLDAVLKTDPKGRVACETFVSTGLVIVGGEITTKAYVEIPNLVKSVIEEIGYTDPKYGFAHNSCAILNGINRQSPDIAQGVDTGGAGDQGMMFGYACRETKELMPLPIMLAHQLTHRLAQVRKKKILDYLGPDGKSQVTVEYDGHKPIRVSGVVIATQHTEKILDRTGKRITEKARREIINKVVMPVVKKWVDKKTKYYINQTGKFVIGGPQSDTGVTGRKIIVDTYGGAAPHGGGAFSGKDPTKVDRSASYMARYIAKNLVAAGAASRIGVQLSYVIGRADPTSVMVSSSDDAKVSNEKLVRIVRKHFDLTPKGIIKSLKLLRPVYARTAAYGHFGRTGNTFTWEKVDKVAALKKQL